MSVRQPPRFRLFTGGKELKSVPGGPRWGSKCSARPATCLLKRRGYSREMRPEGRAAGRRAEARVAWGQTEEGQQPSGGRGGQRGKQRRRAGGQPASLIRRPLTSLDYMHRRWWTRC